MKKLISRILTKMLFWDSAYFKNKLLLHPSVHGPLDRLIVGHDTDLNNTIVNTISGTVEIGDYAFFGHNCQVLTGTHDYTFRDNERRKHPTKGRDIKIGRGAWIGSGAIILGNVTIADHAVIAAGSVVIHNCPEAAIYAGIPAKKIRLIEFES